MPDTVPASSSLLLRDLYGTLRGRFRDAGLDTPDLDARTLLCHALSIKPIDLISESDRAISSGERQRTEEIVLRRLAREPVARILGEREFWGQPFQLSASTLEPRPDTETLVEAVSTWLHKRVIQIGQDAPRLLDIGTGSGVILISLLLEFCNARGTGTDISASALETARQNARNLAVDERARFAAGNYLDAIQGCFDVIVSNPPYIASAEIADLAPEVALFDPLAALDGGSDGLDGYRAIFESALRNLSPDGLIAVEIGHEQSGSVTAIAHLSGFSTVETVQDLGNRDRVVLARP